MKHLLSILLALLLAACAPAPTTIVTDESGARYDKALLPESATVEYATVVDGYSLLICFVREPIPPRNDSAPQRFDEMTLLCLFDKAGRTLVHTQQLHCDSADLLGSANGTLHLQLRSFYPDPLRTDHQITVYRYATLDIPTKTFTDLYECPPQFETDDGNILLHNLPHGESDSVAFGVTLFGTEGTVSTVPIPPALADDSMWDRIITYSEEPYSPTDLLTVSGGRIATVSNQKSTYTINFETGEVFRSLAYTQEMLSSRALAQSEDGTRLMLADTWGRGDAGSGDTVLVMPSGQIQPLVTNALPRSALFAGNDLVLLNFIDALELYDVQTLQRTTFHLEHATRDEEDKLLYPIVGIGYDVVNQLYLCAIRDLTQEDTWQNEAPFLIKVFDQNGRALRTIALDERIPLYNHNYFVPFLLAPDGNGSVAVIDEVLWLRKQDGISDSDECRATVRYLF